MRQPCGHRWLVTWDPDDRMWLASCRTCWENDRHYPTWRLAFFYAHRMAGADR